MIAKLKSRRRAQETVGDDLEIRTYVANAIAKSKNKRSSSR
jgi:hypothetical protein